MTQSSTEFMNNSKYLKFLQTFTRRDPLNGALPYTNATNCEIAATLNGLTKLKILGELGYHA